MSNNFWENKRLDDMTQDEWESLCDRCGRCCLVKLEHEETNELACTNLSCSQLDLETISCRSYENRQEVVPTCMVLTPEKLKTSLHFVPDTCAYKLIYEGKPLYEWHPLISGKYDSVFDSGVSVYGKIISENDVPDENIEDHIVDCNSLI